MGIWAGKAAYWQKAIIFLSLTLLTIGCEVTSHERETMEVGQKVDAVKVFHEQVVGPITFRKWTSATWQVELSGLVELDHDKAQSAKLEDRLEAIEIYAYTIDHPKFGRYLIDTAVSQDLKDGVDEIIPTIMASMAHMDLLKVKTSQKELLQATGPLDGVFLTHMHFDHILGFPDLPKNLDIFVGPGEPSATAFLNLFAQGVTDNFLSGHKPLRVLDIPAQESGMGALDFFQDGSFIVLWLPGHTPGSLGFLIQSTTGPQLIVGDTCHTAWGWRNDVPPGTFTHDQDENRKRLSFLTSMARQYPKLQVHLGHQSL